ncbi:MAG: phosphoribosylanthranilate isomerase [Alphaproteobacteria bacterium]|nr:phosphoribosylanthranilate isomerase [Alphaproteobacteria bacterium]
MPQPTTPHPIKLCGMMRPEDIAAAAQAGANWVGVIHVPQSPRWVDGDQAARLLAAAQQVGLVGVLVVANLSPPDILKLVRAARPAMLQLHGQETPDEVAMISQALSQQDLTLPIIKAVAVNQAVTPQQVMAYAGRADWLLLDRAKNPTKNPVQTLSSPTSNPQMVNQEQGAAADSSPASWAAANPMGDLPWLLAGGLTAENVAAQVALGRPHGVDVASGIEAAPQRHPGAKDLAMMQAFVQNAAAALAGLSP